MRTRIISAFPGTGKSFYENKFPDTTLDSDSSSFSWINTKEGKVRNPEFPENYISLIKENIGNYEFIFVSSHKEVREALLDNCIHFYLVYPPESAKDIYIKRYENRGSPDSFIQLLKTNWEKWIKECCSCKHGCTNIKMVFTDLEKELSHIVRTEQILEWHLQN